MSGMCCRETLKHLESRSTEYQEITCCFYLTSESPFSFPFCIHNFVFQISCKISYYLADWLVTVVLINNLWDAKIVMSRSTETHCFPAAVLNDVSFQSHAWLTPWKFSEERVIIPLNDKCHSSKTWGNAVPCEDSREHFLSSDETSLYWDCG